MSPSNSEPGIAAAILRYQEGDYAAAATIFAQLRTHTPDDPTILRLHGLALTRAGRVKEALPLLARARARAFTQPLAHLHYGIALQSAGQFARAAATCRRATMLAPNAPAGWINFAVALIALNQPQAARAAARRAVELTPSDADARYTMGRAELAVGNPRGARNAFLVAARLRPDFTESWVNLGIACYRLGQIEPAMRAMTKVLEIEPLHADAEANLCAFMLLRGETEAAVTRLQALLEREPHCISARLNLVNALLLDRDAVQALALLDGPPPGGRDGAHWRAHLSMALLLLGQNDAAASVLDAITEPYDAEILVLWRRIYLALRARDVAAAEAMATRMAALADDENGALLEHRIIGHFELARFHDARGRQPTAFEHWHSGHRLLARIQPFSRGAYADFVDASIDAFSAGRLRDGSRSPNQDATPVFVVGMPRSGTTLLEQILSAHAMVYGAGERPALNDLVRRLMKQGSDDPHALAALSETELAFEAADFLAELHALAPQAQLIVDKMPDNARYLGFIATLLPGARVILCQRDPRDIGLSIYQHRFFGYHPYAHDLGDLGWTFSQHERLMGHWRAVLPIPLMEVALTDWVTDFSGTLAKVLRFLGLPDDPACDTFHLQRRKIRTASAAQVMQPVNARGIGRWRRYAAELAPMIKELEAGCLLSTRHENDGQISLKFR